MLCLVAQSCPTLFNPMDCSPKSFSVHEDSPGKNTGEGCHGLLQGIFPPLGLNPGLIHCRQILYRLRRQGSLRILEWVAYPFFRGTSQSRSWTGVSCIAGGFFTSWATREASLIVTTIQEGWARKNWCFWTVVLEKMLESPLDSKEIQPVHSEGDQPWDFFGRNDAKAETPVLWPPHAKSWVIGKDSDAGRHWGQEEKGTTEDEMARWHHWLNGHESEWTPGDGDGQGGLVCCDSDTTERLIWSDLIWCIVSCHLQTVRVLLLVQSGFLLFLFLLWLLWLGLPKLCWIIVKRVGSLVLFLFLEEMLSVFLPWE